MAMKDWSAADLNAVADDLEYVITQLRAVSAEMQEKKFLHLKLQAEAAFSTYRSTLVKVAGDVVSEFRDQYRCFQTGEIPRWKRNQKAIEARRKSKADLEAKGIAPGKAATKKATKKKGRQL